MEVETELKVRLKDQEFESLQERLQTLGAQLTTPRHFEVNLLFDTEEGRLRLEDRMLRLRSVGERNLLTYKGPLVTGHSLKIRPEAQIELSDPVSANNLLEGLGFRAVFRYDKYRAKWTWDLEGEPLEICVDETPVGNFIEIEGTREKIRKAARSLALDEDRFIVASYAELYEAAGLGSL